MRLGCVACAATVLMLVGAAPADAHLIGTNALPTNYRTSILAVSPPVRGLQVRVAEIGGALELVNRTGQQVVVLGARLEPYLRVEVLCAGAGSVVAVVTSARPPANAKKHQAASR